MVNELCRTVTLLPHIKNHKWCFNEVVHCLCINIYIYIYIYMHATGILQRLSSLYRFILRKCTVHITLYRSTSTLYRWVQENLNWWKLKQPMVIFQTFNRSQVWLIALQFYWRWFSIMSYVNGNNIVVNSFWQLQKSVSPNWML